MAARQTIIAHLNSEFKKLNEREYNSYSAIALDTSGQFISYSNTNYIQSVSSVKDAASYIDAQLYSVATTYAPTSYVIEKISSVVGGAPEYLDTLGEIAAALNNDASFAANFISSIVVEEIFATDAENTIALNLSSQFISATTAELSLQQDISGEIQRAQGVESTIRYDLSGEIQRAINKETELYDSYLSTVTDRVTSFGSYSNDFSTLSFSLQSSFTSSLQGEIDRAQAAELQLRKDLSGESIRAIGAISTLSFDVSGELLRATGAESTIQGNLFEETQRASAAEDALSGRLSTIESTYINKDGSVAMTSSLVMNTNTIMNVASAIYTTDLVNKNDVINSISLLGAPFSDAGEFNVQTMDISSLLITPGATYTVTGGSLSIPIENNLSKIVETGDKIVRRNDGYWDVFNNTDILIYGTSDKVDITGDGFVGYTATIPSTYVGQSSITTTGTIIAGTWQASPISTEKGGLPSTVYSQGDLITGNGETLRVQSISSANTILAARDNVIQWIPSDTNNHSITDTTNFSGKQNLQEALDFLFTRFQQRQIVQFHLTSSGISSSPSLLASTLDLFLSGKIIFMNFDISSTTIYLPPSNTSIVDGTIVRLVHNGNYTDANLKVVYRNTETDTDIEVVEMAPHETTSLIWNASSSSWMVGIGI